MRRLGGTCVRREARGNGFFEDHALVVELARERGGEDFPGLLDARPVLEVGGAANALQIRGEGTRRDFEGEEVAELLELAGVQRFADGLEGFDVLEEKVKTFLVLVPRDELEIFLFVNEIEEFLKTARNKIVCASKLWTAVFT